MMGPDRLAVPAQDGDLSTAPTSPASSFDDQLAYSPEVVKGAARFDDFRTVDWLFDCLNERRRRLHEAKQSHGKISAPVAWLLRIYQAGQSWLVVGLVGASKPSDASRAAQLNASELQEWPLGSMPRSSRSSPSGRPT